MPHHNCGCQKQKKRCCPVRVIVANPQPCPCPGPNCASLGVVQCPSLPFACETLPASPGNVLQNLCALGNLIYAETLACPGDPALCRIGFETGRVFAQTAAALGITGAALDALILRINQNLCCAACPQRVPAVIIPPTF